MLLCLRHHDVTYAATALVKLSPADEAALPPVTELFAIDRLERASKRPHTREDEETLDLGITQVGIGVDETLQSKAQVRVIRGSQSS